MIIRGAGGGRLPSVEEDDVGESKRSDVEAAFSRLPDLDPDREAVSFTAIEPTPPAGR